MVSHPNANSLIRNPFRTETKTWDGKWKRINATSCSQFAFRSGVVFIFHKIMLSCFNKFVLYTHLTMTEILKILQIFVVLPEKVFGNTVKPRFIVFVGGPEKNDGCGKTIDAGPI
jgi:hypothetical protein